MRRKRRWRKREGGGVCEEIKRERKRVKSKREKQNIVAEQNGRETQIKVIK